jgi:membrane-associated phospholipid phosphatase
VSTDKKPTLFARATALIAAGFLLAALLWLAHALDPLAQRYIHLDNPLKLDWVKLFRITGYLPTWLLAGAAVWMIDARARQAFAWPSIRRAVWLAANPALTGLVCEITKLAVRRERPESATAQGAQYIFRAWETTPWSTSGLGFPSSHVGVSAGAACALICLFPKAWPVWTTLPLACAATRLFEQDHYLSDCVGAMVAAILTTVLLMPLFNRANKRV